MPAVWPIEVEKKEEGAPAYGLKHLLPPLLIGSSIGGAIYYFQHGTMAIVIWSISGILFLSGLLAPRIYRKAEHGLGIFAVWVGRVLTILLLVPFYYLVFVPGRLFFKLCGKDPMTRKWPAGLDSYWVTRKENKEPQVHFRRQF